MMTLNGTELKASTVLQAMVTGLKKSKDDPNFVIEMGNYGQVEVGTCYGCVVSLALAEMFGNGKLASEMMLAYVKTRFNPPISAYAHLSSVIESDPSRSQDSLPINVRKLEYAVHKARTGDVSWLINFLTGEVNESFNRRWILDSNDWERQLPKIETTIAEMIAAGY